MRLNNRTEKKVTYKQNNERQENEQEVPRGVLREEDKNVSGKKD